MLPFLVICLASLLTAEDIQLPNAPLDQAVPGLRVEPHEYPELNAVEWQLRLHGTNQTPATLYEDLRSADFEIAFSQNTQVDLHWNKGSHAEPSDFQPLSQTLAPGSSIKLESFGGRSSDGVLPYFNLASADGGMIVAVGWSGDWQANFERQPNGKVRVNAGLKRSHFKLPAGEEVRLPSILVMAYRGPWIAGQNQFRRLMLRHFTPTNHAPLQLMPVAASVHGMFGFNDTTDQNLTALAQDIAALQLPIDTFWLDAGWNEGGFPRGQGNSQADPVRFPKSLRPVGQAASRAGLRFLAWFEPERAMRGTRLSTEHPDWLLQPSKTPDELRYMENDGFQLVDLGNPAARAWAIEMSSTTIRDAGIQFYRQDFNQYPAYFWHTQELPDELGLREVRYITGLYDFLDELARRHPNLIMDHCASGGRRLDFEIMRRCVSLWRSDSCWDDAKYPRNAQAMTHGLSHWIPLHGLGSVSTSDIALRSGMGACASFAINYRDANSVAALRQHLTRYLAIRPLYMADFYPLTAWTDDPKEWLAFQFFDNQTGAGLIQAFCGEGAPAMQLRLQALDRKALYEIIDWDQPDAKSTLTGEELMSRGLALPSAGQPHAKVFAIKRQ